MKINEKGILNPSQIYLYSPSTFARNALFYVDRCGEYFCDNQYSVSRSGINAHIIFLVTKGTLFVDYGNRTFEAKEGEIIFIDCSKPHKYYAADNVECKWIHIAGNSVKYYEELLNIYTNPIIITSSFPFIHTLTCEVISMYKNCSINEHRISLLIASILSCFCTIEEEQYDTAQRIVINAAKYIRENYSEDISVKEIAFKFNISQFHFIRTFKKVYNCTPYEYVLNRRLSGAKKLLLTTGLTISEIGRSCGFNNQQNFIRAFKLSENVTPTNFRKYSK